MRDGNVDGVASMIEHVARSRVSKKSVRLSRFSESIHKQGQHFGEVERPDIFLPKYDALCSVIDDYWEIASQVLLSELRVDVSRGAFSSFGPPSRFVGAVQRRAASRRRRPGRIVAFVCFARSDKYAGSLSRGTRDSFSSHASASFLIFGPQPFCGTQALIWLEPPFRERFGV